MNSKQQTAISEWRNALYNYLVFSLPIFTILLAALNLPAQNPFIQLYTTSDGLPSNKVIQMYQDSKKFIWFATAAGLVRYDGLDFKQFQRKDGLSYFMVNAIQ